MRENKLKNVKWGFYCICNQNTGQLATHCNQVMVALEKWLYILVSEHIATSEEEILLQSV